MPAGPDGLSVRNDELTLNRSVGRAEKKMTCSSEIGVNDKRFRWNPFGSVDVYTPAIVFLHIMRTHSSLCGVRVFVCGCIYRISDYPSAVCVPYE